MTKQIGDIVNNKSVVFLLPMIGQNFSEFKSCKGVFCFSETDEQENKLYLLFDTDDSLHAYRKDILMNNKYFDNLYEIGNYDLFVFDVPNKLVDDYNLFKEGLYSKMSDDYKRHILRFHNNTYKYIDKLKDILYRTEKGYKNLEKELDLDFELPRTQELASIPDKEKETFTFSLIRTSSENEENDLWI